MRSRPVAVPGIRVIEHVLAAKSRIPTHRHGDDAWVIMLDGRFSGHAATREFGAAAGQAVLVPSDLVHRESVGPGRGRAVFVVPPNDRGIWAGGDPLRVHGGAGLRRITARLRTELDQPDDLSPLALQSLVIELAVTVNRQCRSERRSPSWIRRIPEVVDAVRPGSASLVDIASALGVSPSHLARVFRREHGCSLGAWIRRRRIHHAERLLRDHSIPLSHVAALAGFSDQSHLTTAFRRARGVTPGTFRRGS